MDEETLKEIFRKAHRKTAKPREDGTDLDSILAHEMILSETHLEELDEHETPEPPTQPPTSEESDEETVFKCGNCDTTVTMEMTKCPGCNALFVEEEEEEFECPFCKMSLRISTTKCPSCNAIFEEIEIFEEEKCVCPECGTLNATNALKCCVCGTSFVEVMELDADLAGLNALETLAREMEKQAAQGELEHWPKKTLIHS